MLANNLIIVMFNLPWEWSTDYTNQTAYELGKKNFVICYMLEEMHSLKELILKRKFPRLIQKKSDSLYIYRPLHFLPFKRLIFISNINIIINVLIITMWVLLLKRLRNLNKLYLWVFDPAYYDIYHLFNKKFVLLYDCVDYFVGSRIGQERIIKEKEDKLLRESDYVFTISHTLKKIHSKVRKDIYVVPQGFRLKSFKNANYKLKITLPKGKPIVGYVGAVNYRLDYKLLINVASELPKFNFVFVGPIQKDYFESFEEKLKKLLDFKNVYHISNRPKSEIPAIINNFDICIIPYNTSLDFNKHCYPMKLFEYLYLGKQVISTSIEELKRFTKYISMSNQSQNWTTSIQLKIENNKQKKIAQESRQIAISNSWKEKINAISKCVE